MTPQDERRFLEALRAKLVPESRLRARPSPGTVDERDEDDSAGSFLAIDVGAERMLVPIAAVEEVIVPPEPTLVPRVKDWVKGTFMQRGILVPLVDAAGLFGIPAPATDREGRVVIVGRGEDVMGLAVAAVRGIVAVGEESWEPLPAPHRFVSKATRLDGDLAGLLDVDALLSLPSDEATLRERSAG